MTANTDAKVLEERETADEKRLRLAQEYLDKLGAAETKDELDTHTLISSQLEEDAVCTISLVTLSFHSFTW